MARLSFYETRNIKSLILAISTVESLFSFLWVGFSSFSFLDLDLLRWNIVHRKEGSQLQTTYLLCNDSQSVAVRL